MSEFFFFQFMSGEILCYKPTYKQNTGNTSCIMERKPFSRRRADYVSSNQSSQAYLYIISFFTKSQKQYVARKIFAILRIFLWSGLHDKKKMCKVAREKCILEKSSPFFTLTDIAYAVYFNYTSKTQQSELWKFKCFYHIRICFTVVLIINQIVLHVTF